MIYNFFRTKMRVAILIIAISIGIVFILNFAIKYRVKLVGLMPENTMVSEEQLNKDISTILSLYGLKKSTADLVIDVSHPNYKKYCEEETEGKGLFIHADPILYASNRSYTEVETYMEIWLYVIEHNFDYEIDGIVYYFTAPSFDSLLAPLPANEIYMTMNDFLSMYGEIDSDKLNHHQEVKELTKKYIYKTGYKRRDGHVQVR